MLHRHHDSYPPAGWEDTLGLVYARALAITGTGDRPIVLTGNLWGFMYYSDQSGVQDYGPLGTHLIEAGPAAARHLVPLLDDPASLFYEGSREATLGNSRSGIGSRTPRPITSASSRASRWRSTRSRRSATRRST
ncbi:MAG: hypothetical protein M3O90_01345, partial [Actinomycetota bacterium]|nr:hypothetical protein [Actinomycetota bacterium]